MPSPHCFAISDVLDVPSMLLRRLYEIEDISSRRQMPPGFHDSRRRKAEVTKLLQGNDWEEDSEGLGREEAINFMEAFALSEDGDSFPAQVAWELQSKLWMQPHVEVTSISYRQHVRVKW